MTCEEFFESYVNGDYKFDTLIDEMYWDGDVNTDYLFKYLVDSAKKNEVVLSDVDTFDYDSFLYDVYENTEKGLS